MTAPSVRLSLLWCERCGRAYAATPAEVRRCARDGWPKCCAADLVLYIEADRPAPDAAQVTAVPLPLPGTDPAADTAVLPTPPARVPPPNG